MTNCLRRQPGGEPGCTADPVTHFLAIALLLAPRLIHQLPQTNGTKKSGTRAIDLRMGQICAFFASFLSSRQENLDDGIEGTYCAVSENLGSPAMLVRLVFQNPVAKITGKARHQLPGDSGCRTRTNSEILFSAFVSAMRRQRRSWCNPMKAPFAGSCAFTCAIPVCGGSWIPWTSANRPGKFLCADCPGRVRA